MAPRRSTLENLPIKDVLMCFDIGDWRILKFWLLILCGQISCFLWMLCFSWSAGLLADRDTSTTALSRIAQKNLSSSHYIDIFLALATGCALDATFVVFNFNRSLIQQFHYFVSLRLVMLAMLISFSVPFLIHDKAPRAWGLGVITCTCGFIYAFFIIITDRLHTLFDRRISARHSSLSEFARSISLAELPWTHCWILAFTNLLVYLYMIRLLPSHWYPLIPVVQIAGEPFLHYLMKIGRTHRYNMLIAPFLHASICFEWGFRQMIQAPRLTVAPSTYLGLILASRLLLDLHLSTVFRHRKDLHWARQNVLLSNPTLLGCLAALLMVEHLGIPVATYIKPIVVVFMDSVGLFPHLISSSYAIAFGKVKSIRS